MGLDAADFARTADTALVNDLLRCVFPDGPPSLLSRLLNRPLAARHMLDFKFGPVLPVDAEGPLRLAIASVGEGEGWLRRLEKTWPEAGIGAFMEGVDPSVRVMLDILDHDNATLYLDDLQDVSHGFTSPAGEDLLAVSLDLNSGDRTAISRHDEVPLESAEGEWLERLRELKDMGAMGQWGVRWKGDELVGVLCVTEKSNTEDVDAMLKVIEELGAHPVVTAMNEVLESRGWIAYPDALEMRAEGFELTVGVLDRG
jgi:hypothetical protein